MVKRTKTKYMPVSEKQAISWVMQRASKTAMLGSMCFRFGPSGVDEEWAEECLTKNKSVPQTNIQEFADSVEALDRSVYVWYAHMSGLSPEIAAPGLVERLKYAEECLKTMSDNDVEGAKDYFNWLRKELYGQQT